LGTDLVAVSYSYLFIYGYHAFGNSAELCIATEIYIYNQEGKLVANQTWSSKRKWLKIVGDDVTEYKAVLNLLPDILDDMMIKVSKKAGIK
jgi:hypothetical protein